MFGYGLRDHNAEAENVRMNTSYNQVEDASNTGDVCIGDPSVADVILEVEGRQIHVTKSILIHASPVFRSMFTSGLKEQNTGGIPFPGKDFDSFVLFMKCIYPMEFIKLDEYKIAKILPLAHEYAVSSLKSQCEEWLINQVNLMGPQSTPATATNLFGSPNKDGSQFTGFGSTSSTLGSTAKYGNFEFFMKCLYYGAEYELHMLYKQALALVVLHGADKYWDNEHYKRLAYKQKCELLESKLKQTQQSMLGTTTLGSNTALGFSFGTQPRPSFGIFGTPK